jgi:hypothetical protein
MQVPPASNSQRFTPKPFRSDVGLCEALVNFSRTFSPDRPAELVRTERHKYVCGTPAPRPRAVSRNTFFQVL